MRRLTIYLQVLPVLGFGCKVAMGRGHRGRDTEAKEDCRHEYSHDSVVEQPSRQNPDKWGLNTNKRLPK